MDEDLALRAVALLTQYTAAGKQPGGDDQVAVACRTLAAIPLSPHENVGQAISRAGQDPSAEPRALAALSAVLPYHPELQHVLRAQPAPAAPALPANAGPRLERFHAARHRRVLVALVAALAVVIVIVVAANRSSSGWSPAVQADFMASCTASSGGDASACGCVMAKLEGQYSQMQITVIEEQIASGQEPAAFAQAAQADVAACS